MCPPAKAMTQSNDDSFDFAVMRTPAWVLTATTSVNWSEPPTAGYPTVASVECRGESRQFVFDVNRSAEISWLRTRFLGKADEDGERDEITLLGDRLWLYIDGERWEYANIPTHSAEFSNIQYPPPKSDIVLPVWRGYQAVRRAEDQPWINLKLIYYRLINADQIEWSFKSRLDGRRQEKCKKPASKRLAKYTLQGRQRGSANCHLLVRATCFIGGCLRLADQDA
jgi:hypothetical protein